MTSVLGAIATMLVFVILIGGLGLLWWVGMSVWEFRPSAPKPKKQKARYQRAVQALPIIRTLTPIATRHTVIGIRDGTGAGVAASRKR